MKATIKDNKAYCPVCDTRDYRIISHGLEDGSIYFECKCKSCNGNFNYKYNCKNMKDKRF